jgi:hypothetical protein
MVLDGSPRNVVQVELIAGWCAETGTRLGVWVLSLSPEESRVRLDARQASAQARDESVGSRLALEQVALGEVLGSLPKWCALQVSKAGRPLQDVGTEGADFLAALSGQPDLRRI